MMVKKLGQPVPLSYFISEVKSGKLQPTQAKTPGRFSLFSGLELGRSVPSSRSIANCMGSSRLRHSSFDTLSDSEGSGTLRSESTRLNSSHVAISYAVFCL